MKHGIRSTYVNHKCRCDLCTEANKEYMQSIHVKEKPCTSCGLIFRSTAKKCYKCLSKEKACISCGKIFRDTMHICSTCRYIERTCECGRVFKGRSRMCNMCRNQRARESRKDIKIVRKGKGKTCSKCNVFKHWDDFQNVPAWKILDGKASQCTFCRDEYLREYHNRTYSSGKQRYKHIPRVFNITEEEVLERLQDQDHRCMLCGWEPEEGSRSLSLDHNHNCCPETKSCGKCIRAWLCTQCNAMLGMAKDNANLLRLGAEYLEWFNLTEGTK